MNLSRCSKSYSVLKYIWWIFYRLGLSKHIYFCGAFNGYLRGGYDIYIICYIYIYAYISALKTLLSGWGMTIFMTDLRATLRTWMDECMDLAFLLRWSRSNTQDIFQNSILAISFPKAGNALPLPHWDLSKSYYVCTKCSPQNRMQPQVQNAQ